MPYTVIDIIRGRKRKGRPFAYETVGWQVCFKDPETGKLTPCEKGYFKVEVHGHTEARVLGLALRDRLNAREHA